MTEQNQPENWRRMLADLGLCEDDDKLLSTLARYLRKCHG